MEPVRWVDYGHLLYRCDACAATQQRILPACYLCGSELIDSGWYCYGCLLEHGITDPETPAWALDLPGLQNQRLNEWIKPNAVSWEDFWVNEQRYHAVRLRYSSTAWLLWRIPGEYLGMFPTRADYWHAARHAS